jgi:hypothetical protein
MADVALLQSSPVLVMMISGTCIQNTIFCNATPSKDNKILEYNFPLRMLLEVVFTCHLWRNHKTLGKMAKYQAQNVFESPENLDQSDLESPL